MTVETKEMKRHQRYLELPRKDQLKQMVRSDSAASDVICRDTGKETDLGTC